MPDTTSVPPVNTAPAPRVDRLEVLQELGRGSIGTVQKAKLAQFERLVALRQFQVPQWLDDVQDLLNKIVGEAKAAGMLQHPGIAKIYTCGYKDFTVFMTSEFVEGSTLREVMASRQVPLPEVLALGKQLCAAMDHAHAKGAVHHNLNPANIKVVPNGTLKVLDFGLPKNTHLLAQTPAKKMENEPYFSPEEIRHRPIDKAANLFTIATILYELLTTRNPFQGKHLGEIDRNITEVPPHPLNLAHPRVTEAVSRVIMKGLAKNPAERYQSATEMISALEEAMKGTPGTTTSAALQPARPATAPTSQNLAAPISVGEETIKISPPKQPAVVTAPASAAVNTPAKTVSTTSATTTTARMRAAALPAKRKGIWPPTKNTWIIAGAGGACLLMLVAILIVVLRRPPASPQEPASAPHAVASSGASTSDAATAPSDAAPALEVREIGTKTGKPVKPSAKTNAQPVAPVQPAGPVTGELAVSSLPLGATIEIEGFSQSWKAPQVFNSIAPGTYKVTVSLAGYASETRTVTVTAGSRVGADIKLAPLKGLLTVSGTPTGARITIDGHDSGKISPAEFTLEPGAHEITLHKEGYLDAEGNVKLSAGQNVTYAPSLLVAGRTDNIKTVGGISKIFGGKTSTGMVRVEIRTQPKGAQIVINGSVFGKVTPVDIQMEPGNYDVLLKKDGYKPVRTSVIVTLGEKVRIDETLLPQ